jgi:hypothetical protein
MWDDATERIIAYFMPLNMQEIWRNSLFSFPRIRKDMAPTPGAGKEEDRYQRR